MSPASALDSIRALLVAHAGFSFAAHQSADVRSGIQRAMARHDRHDIEAYAADLEAGALPLGDLAEELTIGETYFFREPAQLEFVRRAVLPELRDRQARGAGPRIWSAGCASGEEAYSLAILLDEEGSLERSCIVGTDISRRAIREAKRATYRAWSMRGLDPARIAHYFGSTREPFTPDERIRAAVTFEHDNLVAAKTAAGPRELDLILCRNVLIYFHPAAVRTAARRLLQSLAPGGWLITGATDPPLREDDLAERVTAPEGLFYRRREPSAAIMATARSDERAYDAPPLCPRLDAAEPARRLRDVVRSAGEAQGDPSTLDRPPVHQDPRASVLRVRALADRGHAAAAMDAVAIALERFPLSAEIHYLRALLLVGAQRDQEAAQAARRVLYLEPSAAAAYLLLGSILARLGEIEDAARACRNAHEISAAQPKDEPALFADGESAEQLARAAAQMERRLRSTRDP